MNSSNVPWRRSRLHTKMKYFFNHRGGSCKEPPFPSCFSAPYSLMLKKLFPLRRKTNAAPPHPDGSKLTSLLTRCCLTASSLLLLTSGGGMSSHPLMSGPCSPRQLLSGRHQTEQAADSDGHWHNPPPHPPTPCMGAEADGYHDNLWMGSAWLAELWVTAEVL